MESAVKRYGCGGLCLVVSRSGTSAALPWTIEEANNACFIVRDSTGQALGYFYYEDEPGRRSAAKLLTKDEARRLIVKDATGQALTYFLFRGGNPGGARSK